MEANLKTDFTEEASKTLGAFGNRKIRWAIFRIPEGRDGGCEVEA